MLGMIHGWRYTGAQLEVHNYGLRGVSYTVDGVSVLSLKCRDVEQYIGQATFWVDDIPVRSLKHRVMAYIKFSSRLAGSFMVGALLRSTVPNVYTRMWCARVLMLVPLLQLLFGNTWCRAQKYPLPITVIARQSRHSEG